MLEALQEWLSRRPFEPFRVVLSSGEGYEVRHPEMAFLLKGGMYIALPAGNGEVPDRATYCSMLHITSVEPLVPQTRQ